MRPGDSVGTGVDQVTYRDRWHRSRSRGKEQQSLPSCAAAMSSGMTFATGWEPELRGERLQPCQAIQRILDDEERPSIHSPKDKKWVPSQFQIFLKNVPEAQNAIKESVLGIWRLRTEEENGPDEPLWQDHLEAWLVR